MNELREETFQNGELSLRFVESKNTLRVEWRGSSMAREPGQFLTPILWKALETATEQKKPLVLDFQELEYLNSSTLSPVIRLLEHARRGQGEVKVLYNKKLKWQSLSFTGLNVFKTPDARIDVQGL